MASQSIYLSLDTARALIRYVSALQESRRFTFPATDAELAKLLCTDEKSLAQTFKAGEQALTGLIVKVQKKLWLEGL